jgi:AcrR family transcriptional regulator
VAPPTATKGDKARERVLDAVVEAVAARGLADLSIADIGDAAGMSAGHVMYYFGTKDALFVEALRHSEGFLDGARSALLARAGSPTRTLRDYVALYLPTGKRDARWSLWLEVWNQSLTHPELSSVQLELDARWQRDLESIIQAGVATSDFEVADPALALETVSSLLDGVAVRMITGTPSLGRRKAITLATAACGKLLSDRPPPRSPTLGSASSQR